MSTIWERLKAVDTPTEEPKKPKTNKTLLYVWGLAESTRQFEEANQERRTAEEEEIPF